MAFWGCDFYCAIGHQLSLNAANLKTSLRFTAKSNKTVSDVYLRISVYGTPPTYRVGLQADSAGEPSGVFPGYGDMTPTLGGFRGATLGTQVPLTQGNVYHLVAQYQSGTIDGSNYIDVMSLSPVQNKYPLDMSSDANSNCLWYDGISWSVLDEEPPYSLHFTDATYQIQPYYYFTNERVYVDRFRGERFTVTGGDKTVTDTRFRVRKAGSPLDDLYYTIYNITDSVLVETGTLVTAAAAPTTMDWVTVSLAASRTLVNGKTYRVYLSSPGGGNVSNCYYMGNLVGASIYEDFSWDGTNSFSSFSNDGGSNWNDYTGNDVSHRFTLGVLPPPAVVGSSMAAKMMAAGVL